MSTTDSITATWQAVADATSYDVAIYEGSNTSGGQIDIQTVNGLSHTFQNLTPNTTYTVEIFALANQATHRDSSRGLATITTDQLPQLATPQPTADLITGGRIEFSWDAIVVTDGASVSYRVRIVRVSNGVTMTIESDTISATSYTLMGLDPVIAYRIEVVATALNHRDSTTGVLTVTTTKQKLPAPTVAQISHTANTDSITVSWNDMPPAAGVTIYEIELVRADSTSDTAEEDVDATQAGSTTFTGLTAGTEYTLSVVSSGDSTEYRRSDAYEVTIRTDAVGQLERPEVTVTWEEDADIVDIVVSWTAITNASSYEVKLYRGSLDTVADTRTVGVAATTVRFDSVLPNITYSVGVIARSDTLTDSAEGVASTTIPVVELSAPTAAHIRLSATTNSVTVSFLGTPSDRVTVYLLELTSDSQSEEEVRVPVSEGSYIFADLMPDTEYEVSVVSSREEADYGHYGRSEAYTQRITTDQLPQLDTPDVTATPTTNSITVTWEAVANATAYEVSLYAGNSIILANQVGATQTITGLSLMFTDLTPGTEYTVAVVAKANPATHRDSNPGTATITTDQLPLLAQPIITATATTDSITATWLPVPGAVEYKASLYVGNSITANQVGTTLTLSGTNHTFPGLAPNTTYTVRVIAIASERHTNNEGTATVTTEDIRLDTPQITVTEITGGKVSFSWTAITAPNGAAVSYAVRIYRVIGNQEVASLSRTETEHTFTNLAPVTAYRLEVVAIAQGNRDSLRGLRFVTTETQKLPTPTGTQISYATASNSIRVIWANVPSGVSTYEMTLAREDGQGITIERTVAAVPASSIDFDGLTANTLYILSVVSNGDSTRYRSSSTYEVDIRTLQEGQLASPRIQLSIASSVNIVVSWDEIIDASSYNVRLYRGTAAVGAIFREMNNLTTTSVRFEDLTLNTYYTVSVQAISDTTTASSTASRTIRTHVNILPAPAANHMRLSATTNSITVSFTGVPRSDVTVYEISRNGGSRVPVQVSSNEHRFMNLMPGTAHTVSVYSSRDEHGYELSAPFSDSISTLALPTLATPQLLLNRVTRNSIGFSWNTVIASNGVAVNYEASIYREEDNILISRVAVGTATMHTFTNLEPEKSYTVQVVASAFSNEDSAAGSLTGIVARNDTMPPEFPNPADREGITYENVTGTSVALEWTAARDSMIGTGCFTATPPIDCTSSGLRYRLRIRDGQFYNDAYENPYQATLEQNLMTPQIQQTASEVNFVLDRSNSVLIPGRSYFVELLSVTDGLGNETILTGTGYDTAMFTMMGPSDSNNNEIEDSIEAAFDNFDAEIHCGGLLTADSDGDNIANAYELRIGTDCRVADNNNDSFNDRGLTLFDESISLNVERIGDPEAYDAIADVYTKYEPMDVGVGLTTVSNDGYATANATLTALLPVRSAQACSVAGGTVDTEVAADTSNVDLINTTLCGIAGDNLQLPIGFSTIVWKAKDSDGNIKVAYQLYYVAPEATMSPSIQYVHRISGTTQLETTIIRTYVRINYGSASRYNATNYNPSLMAADFMLRAGSVESGIMGEATLTVAIQPIPPIQPGDTVTAVVELSFDLSDQSEELLAAFNASEELTLSIDESNLTSIDNPLSPLGLELDRDEDDGHALSFGILEQEIRLLDKRRFFRPVIVVSPVTQDRFEISLRDPEHNQVIRLDAVLIDASNNTTASLTQRSSAAPALATHTVTIDRGQASGEDLALRVRILGETSNDVLWERHCHFDGTSFCQIAEQEVHTAAGVTATGHLAFRADGLYSNSFVLDADSAPELAASNSEIFASTRAQRSMTFNVQSYDNNDEYVSTFAIAIRLSADIPATGGYMYKYIDGEWREFVESVEEGRLYSAQMQGDECPAVPDPARVGGLSSEDTETPWRSIFSGELDANPWYRSTESADGSKALRGGQGYRCVLLWLVDGGMNDLDKEQNGIISDPVRLGGPTAADDDMPVTTISRRGGGGSISVGTLFLLMLIAIAAVLRRRKQTESFAA